MKPIVASVKNLETEQGNCGIRKRILEGGESRQFAVSEVEIMDAHFHYHKSTWELYIVKKGKGKIILGDEIYDLNEGDIVEIPPGVVHKAIPDPQMTVLVIMSPQNAEKNDIHFVTDERS